MTVTPANGSYANNQQPTTSQQPTTPSHFTARRVAKITVNAIAAVAPVIGAITHKTTGWALVEVGGDVISHLTRVWVEIKGGSTEHADDLDAIRLAMLVAGLTLFPSEISIGDGVIHAFNLFI